MNAFQRLQAAQGKQSQQAEMPVDAEYIEKLASACEHASKAIISTSITADKTVPAHSYPSQPVHAEKTAQAAAAPDLMARLLREKIASKQKTADSHAAHNDGNVVASILAKFAKDTGADLVVREKRVFEAPAAQVAPSAPEPNQAVDNVAALAGTSLADVLEAAQTANGTSDSAATGSTKTAGAQGKGPLTVGSATDRLRAVVMRQSAGK
jgi:hypothetical protein